MSANNDDALVNKIGYKRLDNLKITRINVEAVPSPNQPVTYPKCYRYTTYFHIISTVINSLNIDNIKMTDIQTDNTVNSWKDRCNEKWLWLILN